MSPLPTRLRSALLSGLFLLGTLGVPLVDGALFHLAEQDPCAGITHVEAHGGQHHADQCTLAQPVLAQREALGSAEVVRVAPPESVHTLAAGVVTHRPSALLAVLHSRAPPA